MDTDCVLCEVRTEVAAVLVDRPKTVKEIAHAHRYSAVTDSARRGLI
jgi:hypothetical protein